MGVAELDVERPVVETTVFDVASFFTHTSGLPNLPGDFPPAPAESDYLVRCGNVCLPNCSFLSAHASS